MPCFYRVDFYLNMWYILFKSNTMGGTNMSNIMIKGCTIHHIALQSSDFEKSLKFYTEGLGFEKTKTFVASTGKHVAMLDTGEGISIELFSDGKESETDKTFAGNFFHLALKVDNAVEAYERALKYGGKEMGKYPREMSLPTTPPTPVVIGFIKGPDGEELEFYQTR